MSVELSGETPPKFKKGGASNEEFKFPRKQYSFKDEQVVTIFHLLQKDGKLKLTEVWHPNEVGVRMIPNITSSIEWFIILPINVLPSRTKFNLWSMLEF